jgi:hypothetical protein
VCLPQRLILLCDLRALSGSCIRKPGNAARTQRGRTVPTKAVIQGLAPELDSDVLYLEKLAAEIGKNRA